MPSLSDVHRKFGEASEAAQLLETELGNILLFAGVVDQGLIDNPDADRAAALFHKINRQTLRQLLKELTNSPESADQSADQMAALLFRAFKARNRLVHSFYRQHNFRGNSEEGRARMLEDLASIHRDLLDAYKAIMRLSGVDLDKAVIDQPPGHVPASSGAGAPERAESL